MFETNMDEYLDEEVEYVKQCFETICRSWEKNVCVTLSLSCKPDIKSICSSRSKLLFLQPHRNKHDSSVHTIPRWSSATCSRRLQMYCFYQIGRAHV